MTRAEYKALSRAARTGPKHAQRFSANSAHWAVSRHGVTRLHSRAEWLIDRPAGAEIAITLAAAAYCRKLNPRHGGAREALALAKAYRAENTLLETARQY